MPTVAIKTKGGASAGEIVLSERVFGAKRNIALIHQAVKAELENRRQGTKDSKGRSDTLGGGRKPYKQKGTGRARQGSIISPQFRHGAKALAFHPRDLGHALPKKMRRGAIRSALSAKLADGELIVIDSFPIDGGISTKTAASFLNEVAGGAKKHLVVLDSYDDTLLKSIRNIGSVTIRVAPQFSALDIVDGGVIVVTQAAAAKIESLLGEKKTESVEAEDAEASEEAIDA